MRQVKVADKVSFRQKWNSAQPTKKVVFWFLVAAIILTMITGFTWGGWMTGGTAERMASATAKDAVVQRLALICVAQFNQDAGKEPKFKELQETSAYQRDDYVRDQGWATMPGDEKPDSKVADTCARLLGQISP